MTEPLWWHWLLLGVSLTLAELRFGTWYVCWFGVAALLVSALLYHYPGATFGAQFFLWLVAAATLVWTHAKIAPGSERPDQSPRRTWPNGSKRFRRRGG